MNVNPPRRAERKTSKTCAFTLIELLVVIAIISLLVSILLPSLTKAKELAQKTVCAANLHNFQIAMAMYMEQNDGYLPTSGGYAAGDLTQPYYYKDNWIHLLSSYLDENPNVYNCDYHAPEGSVWTCPSDELAPRKNGCLIQPSYGVNRFLTGWYSAEWGRTTSYRIDEIDKPHDKLPLMSDSDSPWGCTPNHIKDDYGGYTNWNHNWPHRHQDGDMFLFVAGNQEWIPRLESEGASNEVTYTLYVLSEYFTGYCDWWR